MSSKRNGRKANNGNGGFNFNTVHGTAQGNAGMNGGDRKGSHPKMKRPRVGKEYEQYERETWDRFCRLVVPTVIFAFIFLLIVGITFRH